MGCEMDVTEDHSNVQYLDMGLDPDGTARKLAYIKHQGTQPLGIMIVPGYFSGMDLPKTTVVEEFCKQHGFPFVAYESEGTGRSPGTYKHISYNTWVEDALAVLDRLTAGPQILVASSLGGWTASIVTLRRPLRIHSIIHIGIGPIDQYEGTYAVNMAEDRLREYSPEVREKWYSGRVFEDISSWGVKIKYWKAFLDNIPPDIAPNSSINITCPVRLIHALHDDSISYKVAMDYMKRLHSKDVDVIIRKTGNHRLMKKPDRKLIIEVLEGLINNYPANRFNSKL